jgi:hypothetical protein
MNEELRIELADQAKEYASKAYSSRKMGHSKDYYFETKFAQLIIQECIKAIDKTPLGYGDYRDQILESMLNSCAKSIKNHFEVEE